MLPSDQWQLCPSQPTPEAVNPSLTLPCQSQGAQAVVSTSLLKAVAEQAPQVRSVLLSFDPLTVWHQL